MRGHLPISGGRYLYVMVAELSFLLADLVEISKTKINQSVPAHFQASL